MKSLWWNPWFWIVLGGIGTLFGILAMALVPYVRPALPPLSQPIQTLGTPRVTIVPVDLGWKGLEAGGRLTGIAASGGSDGFMSSEYVYVLTPQDIAAGLVGIRVEWRQSPDAPKAPA